MLNARDQLDHVDDLESQGLRSAHTSIFLILVPGNDPSGTTREVIV
jgi:hypothetical protein